MPKKKIKTPTSSDSIIKRLDRITTLVENLLILELGKSGMPQLEIRKMLGGDIHRVNRILKFVKSKK